uniref:Ribosomal RNA methyltransferase FtsJ domain-containing protein n=1 Tax=Zea mays TaxID=4577 RepID=A0A804RJH5_MAIZE
MWARLPGSSSSLFLRRKQTPARRARNNPHVARIGAESIARTTAAEFHADGAWFPDHKIVVPPPYPHLRDWALPSGEYKGQRPGRPVSIDWELDRALSISRVANAIACVLPSFVGGCRDGQAAHSVLDLCAAPGGWVRLSVNHAPDGAFVICVNLVPIRPIRGADSVAGD